MIILIVLLHLILVVNGCICPHSNPSLNFTDDQSLKPNASYQYESWNFDLNLMSNDNPFILILHFSKINNNCNQTNNYQMLNVVYNYMINGNESKTVSKSMIDYVETDLNNLNFYVGNSYVERIKEKDDYDTYAEIWLDNFIFRIKMKDERFSFLLAGQNQNGFVKENILDCNGFYMQNIMNLKVEGNEESSSDFKFNGIGYMDHRMATFTKNSSNIFFVREYQLLGCHTIHWNLGDIRLCFTEIINSTTNQGILYLEGEQFWLNHTSFVVNVIDWWVSPKSNIKYPRMMAVTIMEPFVNYVIGMEWQPDEIQIDNNIFEITVQGVTSIIAGINDKEVGHAMEGIGIISYTYMAL